MEDSQFWQPYSITEKYFYMVLCHLIEKYGNDQGKVIGHDTLTINGIPSFRSFKISQRICKSARKKLQGGKIISFRHIYGEKGCRVGTEYALCEAVFRESPKEIHARIFSKRSIDLSTPNEIPNGVRLVSP